MNDLVSKKEELQAVFDLAANGISILDKDGIFLYANDFFQMMMGYTMEELYKESCISLSSPEYKAPFKSAVERTILEGSVVNFRKICVSKSGEHMNASMSLSYLKSRNQILMITSDITDDIKYQEELKSQAVEDGLFLQTPTSNVLPSVFDSINVKYKTSFTLKSVDAKKKIAYSEEGEEMDFDILMSTPPFIAAKVIRDSGLSNAKDNEGWLPTH
jgi:PAS domain S-box-containing protein